MSCSELDQMLHHRSVDAEQLHLPDDDTSSPMNWTNVDGVEGASSFEMKSTSFDGIDNLSFQF